jgi:nicotinamidase-related amidase
MVREKRALVVVDPQKAFVDARGSLARAFGSPEIAPNVHALGRLVRLVARERDAGVPIVLIKSEYRPGQFTGGRLDTPLSHICVPGANVDCDWAETLVIAPADTIVTKTAADAATSEAYRAVLLALAHHGVTVVSFAGFQLTTCVQQTAISSAQVLGPLGVRAVVLTGASGARAASYLPSVESPSRVEATCAALTAAGVQVNRADLSIGTASPGSLTR